MIVEELRDYLADVCEDAVLFDNPSFDKSIVGITDFGGLVYNYDMMVEEYTTDNNCSYEESSDFISYNTIRTIPYIESEGVAPTIIYPIERGDFFATED